MERVDFAEARQIARNALAQRLTEEHGPELAERIMAARGGRRHRRDRHAGSGPAITKPWRAKSTKARAKLNLGRNAHG